MKISDFFYILDFFDIFDFFYIYSGNYHSVQNVQRMTKKFIIFQGVRIFKYFFEFFLHQISLRLPKQCLSDTHVKQ